jgi:ligand-binding sensor domain-containing protein
MIKKGSSWISHNIAAILSEDKISGFVTDIIEDNNNIIWAFVLGDPVQRTRSAIVRYLNGSWIKFNVPLQFPVEVVSFHLDSSNNLWMACKEGLVKYNQTQGAKIFNNIDYNFFGKHCTSVHVDKNGDVWTTTLDGGLVKIKKGNY